METQVQNYQGLRFAYTDKKGHKYYEMQKERCPICGKMGWCLINMTTKNVVICGREKSDYETNSGQWKHFLNENNNKTEFKPSNKKHYESSKKLLPHELHEKYQLLLDSNFEFVNVPEIENDLKARGVSKNHNDIRRYATLKDSTINIKNVSFKGVPGTFKHYSNWKIKAWTNRLYLPVRNVKQEIVGFQSRRYNNFYGYKVLDMNEKYKKELKIVIQTLVETNKETLVAGLMNENSPIKLFAKPCDEVDEKRISLEHDDEWIADIELYEKPKYTWLSSNGMYEGTTAGQPLPYHLAIPSNQLSEFSIGEKVHQSDRVIITEGILKADIISEKLENDSNIGNTVLSIGGVAQYKSLKQPLKDLGVETVYTAFDMDARTNEAVKNYYQSMLLMLLEMGLKVKVLVWEEEKGKGLDDLLNNNFYPIINDIVYKNP